MFLVYFYRDSYYHLSTNKIIMLNHITKNKTKKVVK